MLDATRHDGLHSDSNLVRPRAAHQISHTSLGHRREENEDGKQGEENAADRSWHPGFGKDGVDGRAQFRAASSLVRGGSEPATQELEALLRLLLHCLGVAPERGGATDGDVDGAPSSRVCARARDPGSLLSLLARSRAPARDIVARGTRKPVRVVDTFSSLLGSPRCDYTCLHTDTHTPAQQHATHDTYTQTHGTLSYRQAACIESCTSAVERRGGSWAREPCSVRSSALREGPAAYREEDHEQDEEDDER